MIDRIIYKIFGWLDDFCNFFYDKFSWIGKLPGDIIINKKYVKIYFPVTSMIILSIILSIIINQLDR